MNFIRALCVRVADSVHLSNTGGSYTRGLVAYSLVNGDVFRYLENDAWRGEVIVHSRTCGFRVCT
jgi:hypothetical protein